MMYPFSLQNLQEFSSFLFLESLIYYQKIKLIIQRGWNEWQWKVWITKVVITVLETAIFNWYLGVQKLALAVVEQGRKRNRMELTTLLEIDFEELFFCKISGGFLNPASAPSPSGHKPPHCGGWGTASSRFVLCHAWGWSRRFRFLFLTPFSTLSTLSVDV